MYQYLIFTYDICDSRRLAEVLKRVEVWYRAESSHRGDTAYPVVYEVLTEDELPVEATRGRRVYRTALAIMNTEPAGYNVASANELLARRIATKVTAMKHLSTYGYYDVEVKAAVLRVLEEAK